MVPRYNLCGHCGKQDNNLREYSEFSHLRECTIKDIDGKVRQSIEPVFTAPVELCYTCYVNVSKKYVNENRSSKELVEA